MAKKPNRGPFNPTHTEIAAETTYYTGRGGKIRKLKAGEGRRPSVNPAPQIHRPAHLPEGGQQVHRENEPEEED